ncbi:MAG TPA: Rne/Rng family ribonuclease [Verrucomicrobia bacterium]|nr:Rne/Rng family ribonuclease [Verrucomicrobiota bacterium]
MRPKVKRTSEKIAQETRLQARTGMIPEEPVFQKPPRQSQEIENAENKAAGIPPETRRKQPGRSGRRNRNQSKKSDKSKESEVKTPEVTEEEAFVPVELVEEKPKTLKGKLRSATQKVIQKVNRILKPRPENHKEVIINVESLETRVAILEDGLLEEFTIERRDDTRLVGSVFKGKIKNLEDGLKAAFIDIGFEKNCFLHYWDIVPNTFDNNIEVVERPGRKKQKQKLTHKDIPKKYPPGSDIIIQVTKGPIGNKGPRVTTNIAIPGRYLVLLPNSDQCGISRKIENQAERQRLKEILRELTMLPEGMGVIIRTVGEGQKKRYFIRDLAFLLEEWKIVQEKINDKSAPPCVFEEPDLIERTVRDFLTEDVERIVVDEKTQRERVSKMIGDISKRSVDKIKGYTETQPIFDRFGITQQLETTFSRQVKLKSGGYIVIDETEALVSVDVNTGRHKSSSKDQESTILKVNLEAADETCRQLRLRNIGGLIVLDYIDMKSRKDQNAVFNRMKKHLKKDRAKTHVLPISQLGLMEMTRQRHSESMRAAVYTDCPNCKGRGKVKSPLTMSVEIQRKLAELLKRRNRDESDFQLRIIVNPMVLDRLRKEDEKLLINMEKKYFGKLSFRADPEIDYEEFRILNVTGSKEILEFPRN